MYCGGAAPPFTTPSDMGLDDDGGTGGVATVVAAAAMELGVKDAAEGLNVNSLAEGLSLDTIFLDGAVAGALAVVTAVGTGFLGGEVFLGAVVSSLGLFSGAGEAVPGFTLSLGADCCCGRGGSSFFTTSTASTFFSSIIVAVVVEGGGSALPSFLMGTEAGIDLILSPGGYFIGDDCIAAAATIA